MIPPADFCNEFLTQDTSTSELARADSIRPCKPPIAQWIDDGSDYY
jgi:hypothetical protein